MAVAAALPCSMSADTARATWLAPRLLLLLLRCRPGVGPLRLELGRGVVPPPSCALVLDDGPEPLLAFLGATADDMLAGARGALTDAAGATHLFEIPAIETASRVVGELPAAQRLSLLRGLAGTAAQLFRLERDVGFVTLLRDLAADLIEAEPPLRLVSDPQGRWVLASAPGAPRGAWHLLTGRAVRRIVGTGRRSLVLDGPVPADALLLPPRPARPRRLCTEGATTPLRSLVQAGLRGTSRGPAQLALEALSARAGHEPGCAALLRDAQLYAPAMPRQVTALREPLGVGLDLALHDHGGGLFVKGWLRDPLGLVAGLALRGAGGSIPLDLAGAPRLARPDIARRFQGAPHGPAETAPGFLMHLPTVPGAGYGAQWRLVARLASGHVVDAVGPPGLLPPSTARDLVLRSAGPVFTPALLDDVLGPTVARLQAAALSGHASPERVEIGGTRRAAVSVIVPLYRNLRFLRPQINAFARDPALRAAELVYVLDSPEQRAEVEHLLRGLALLHGLRLTLLVQPANLGFSSACNAGAAAACGRTLLFLNSDVVPQASGWLAPLLAALGRGVVAAGPKLLFDCGSVQHGGLFFRRGGDGTWLNDHYHKGLPRDWPAACVARRVPGVTGAALLVRRDAFEAVGGFCTDYVIGDFEDSDLCLKLRAAGHEIAFAPAAELFHFERQSIATHAGHARTAAGLLNRRLHHRRWDTAMDALMRRFPRR